MFQLEFMSYVNKYFKAIDENEKNLAFNLLCTLIENNKSEYDSFISSEQFSPNTMQLLALCEKKILDNSNLNLNNSNSLNTYNNFNSNNSSNYNTYNNLNSSNSLNTNNSSNSNNSNNFNANVSNSNVSLNELKNYVLRWQKEYENSPTQINSVQEEIMKELFLKYMPENFKLIRSLLTLQDFIQLKAFQNHLKNYLRFYYSELISNYLDSQIYMSKNFLFKYYKRRKLIDMISALGKYDFKHDFIMEEISK